MVKRNDILLWAGALIGVLLVLKKLTPWVIPIAGRPFENLFASASAQYNLPENLLARVAYQESRFRKDIIDGTTKSSAGAQGIMQIVPAYHPGVNPLVPAEAIRYAAKYLRQLYNQFGSWKLALAGYNAGPGNVVKYGGVPPFKETQNYVSQILSDVPA